MKETILKKLSEIEEKHNITILHAVESGSRAWGFASPDSDYDIRFIYKKPYIEYLTLWDKPDTIEFITEDDLDGAGWDLNKTLQLLAKSNGALLEWLFPPVTYLSDKRFLSQIQTLAKENFSPITTLYHYLGTCKNFMDVCEADNVKLKSYFYAMRSALAGKWIVDKQTIPPVSFNELLIIAPEEVQDMAKKLMAIKAVNDEKYLHPREEIITNFLKETINYNQANASQLSSGRKDNKKLEDFFRNEIQYK
ncbi:nucleotidyltransferase domain-containing protein [Flavobacterium sp. D11R37]|uniref:nucleotidyltransferase domain-containing protein n=1 Tax=Flavobacterium coralii TaxID=2838017 RepID=UPI001CA73198|nr:nucleotidyltransferase domain-containing protein [Flavobacterium coralii]MBY8962824.1 nucleotidyltransferase domain-containing protein [Flavobacterium coralii]